MAASMWKINSFPWYSQHSRWIYWKYGNVLKHIKQQHFNGQRACISTKCIGLEKRAGTSTYDNWVAQQKSHARRSIVVKIPSRHSIEEVYSFCSAYVPVSKITHYSVAQSAEFALVEFNSEEEMKHVIKHVKYEHENPVYSQFLCLNESKHFEMSKVDAPIIEYVLPSLTTVDKALLAANDVTHQMKILYEETRLTQFGSLLRLMVCTQIESILTGIFPNGEVKPFGSSVNGLGKFSCDLDMVYDIESQYLQQEKSPSPLRFQPTFAPSDSMSQVQQNLNVMKDFIRTFLPCCTEVIGILKARVPIVKFKHTFSGVECDLSMHNLTGVYMSELLYLYGECDERVRPLVFAVVRWAKENAITQEAGGGSWFTNFHLTLLVLFFLQQRPYMIIPSLQTLIDSAGEKDQRITQGVDCTFLRDKTKFPKSNCDATLYELLTEFFVFYSSFDFIDRKISLVDGCTARKTNHSPIEIENPLEIYLNAAQIVSRFEVKRLQLTMQDAAWILENSETREANAHWGIVRTFEPLGETKKLLNVQNFFSAQQETVPDKNEHGNQKNRGRASGRKKFTYFTK